MISNPFEPVTPEARAAVAAMIADSYAWFKGLVKDRRKLDDAALATVSDGRVFTGRQGVDLKLVDKIGGEREAIAWLEAEKGVAKGLKVRDWKKQRRIETFGVLSGLAGAVGLENAAVTLGKLEQATQAQLLDGLVAIWQGSALN